MTCFYHIKKYFTVAILAQAQQRVALTSEGVVFVQ